MNTLSLFAAPLSRLISVSALMLVVATQALPKNASRLASGIVKVDGTVTIDGHQAFDGQTIFGHAHVVTARDSESQIVLSNFARLNVAAETDLAFEFAAAPLSATMKSGRVIASVPAGVSLKFQTTDFLITNETAEPVIFTIESRECEGTRLSVTSGRLITSSAGRTLTVASGESLSSESVGASLPQHSSGKDKTGIFVAIGEAVAIILGVALGQNDQDQESPLDFGGQVTVSTAR